MQGPEEGLRILRLLDVKPPCLTKPGPRGPVFFVFNRLVVRGERASRSEFDRTGAEQVIDLAGKSRGGPAFLRFGIPGWLDRDSPGAGFGVGEDR